MEDFREVHVCMCAQVVEGQQPIKDRVVEVALYRTHHERRECQRFLYLKRWKHTRVNGKYNISYGRLEGGFSDFSPKTPHLIANSTCGSKCAKAMNSINKDSSQLAKVMNHVKKASTVNNNKK